MKAARIARCVALAMALAAAGCSDSESIRVLEESKTPPAAARPSRRTRKQYRTLAAMVPPDDDASENAPHWWFFKFSGKTDLVAKNEADFNSSSNRSARKRTRRSQWSGRFQGLDAQKGGSGMMSRFATLKSPDGQAEIAVTRFGGLVSMNVQRGGSSCGVRDEPTRSLPPIFLTSRNSVRLTGVWSLPWTSADPKTPTRRIPTAAP